MAASSYDRINSYIQDAIAAENNFEDALHRFGKTGQQHSVKTLLDKAGSKARTQHERLTVLLKQRGGSPSTAKSALAHLLTFSPLSAQTGYLAEEKNTQHLILTYGAAGAERAMYESLAQAADEAGQDDVVSLARELEEEETEDARQVWPLLQSSARDAFRATLSDDHSVGDALRSYLEDLIAAEKSFESQLVGFSKEGDYPPAQSAFAAHARETRSQYERLTAQLKLLGGSTSVVKGMMAKVFAVAPKLAQIGHDSSERSSQDLIMAHAVECAEMAMYEVFATVASDSNHQALTSLAWEIQKEEKAAADKVWAMLGPCARQSIQQLRLRKAS